MLRAAYETTLGTVELWSEANPDGVINQDSYLVDERSDCLRLAVLDGVTPTTLEPWRLGLDRARYAAEVVRAALASECFIEEALALAQDELYRPEIECYRDRPQTALVACDVSFDQEDWSRVIIALDCEAWIRQGGRWRLLDAGDTRQEFARKEFLDLISHYNGADFYEFLQAEGALHNDEHCWRRTGVGQFEVLRYATFAVSGDWESIVLASDGARLDLERIDHIDEWLGELREWETQNRSGSFKPHDDVTILRLDARS